MKDKGDNMTVSMTAYETAQAELAVIMARTVQRIQRNNRRRILAAVRDVARYHGGRLSDLRGVTLQEALASLEHDGQWVPWGNYTANDLKHVV